jgi:PAS domain S-box-containing protein
MPSSVIAELLASWRAAEREWESTSPTAPTFREASVAVLRAWLAYQAATEPTEPGSFALVADDDHTYVAVSAGVTAALGYEPAELLGRRIEDIAAPDLVALTPDRWRAFLADGRQDGEFRLIAKDGSTVSVGFQARAHHPIPGYHLSRLTAHS